MALSEEQSKAGNRRLKQWIENDKKVVTYRELSREISCHVNLAKNLLLSYHSTHQATATYLLTGPLLRTSTLTYTQLPVMTQAEPKATQSLAHLGGQVKIVDMDQQSDGEANSEVDEDEEEPRLTNDDGANDIGALGINEAEDDHEGELESEETPRWGVVMVSEEGLEEKKKLFEQDKLSIHVYSLSPTPVKDPGQYLLSNLSIRTKKEYSNPAVYGTISGEGFNAATEPMRDGGIDFGATCATTKKKVEPEIKTKKDDKPVAKRETPAPKAIEKKEAVEVKAKPAQAKAETPAAVEAKASTSSAKADSSKAKRRSQSPTKTASAKTKPEPKAKAKDKAGPSSSQARSEEQAAMEAMMGMDMDQEFNMDDDIEDSQATTAATADPAVKAEPSERKRKRRIVKKSKMEMDDKGYMVTKDYDTEESYSGESEPEASTTQAKGKAKSSASAAPKAKPAPPPAASRTGSSTSVDNDRKPNISKTAGGALKKGAGGQSTLQGFFKKK